MPNKSPVLVFGITGKIGSGTSFVAHQLRHTLYSYRYDVEVTKISDLIGLIKPSRNSPAETGTTAIQEDPGIDERQLTAYERTKQLQAKGNELRAHDESALAVAAVGGFIEPKLRGNFDNRVAFILDSLKHPREAEFLRYVFGRAFYTIGVVCNHELRFERLRERKAYEPREFDDISQRDSDENIPHGQKARDTVMHSDYIIRNEFPTPDEIREETERLLGLIFGSTIISPRKDEFGMSLARQAAKKSACLSRQIGSAILNPLGEVLATGCNDAPKFGGGLYDGSSEKDMRCWARGGKCYNNAEQAQIALEIREALREAGVLKGDDEELLKKAEDTIQRTRLKQTIEFSRAVHAEMAAIISIARTGIGGLSGSTLYSTTYPCHYCAKHIVNAGIERVVYFEPYDKSLAVKLHSDALNDSSVAQPNKLTFEPYAGVAPDNYDEFFQIHRERKESGKYVDYGKRRQEAMPLFAPYGDDLEQGIQRTRELYDQMFQPDGGSTDEIHLPTEN